MNKVILNILVLVVFVFPVFAQTDAGNHSDEIIDNIEPVEMTQDSLDSMDIEVNENVPEITTDELISNQETGDSLAFVKMDLMEKDSLRPFRPNPNISLGLQLAIPGAGQMYNKRYLRSAIFIAAEAATIYYALDHNKKANDLYDTRDSYTEGTSEYYAAKAKYENEMDDRNLMIWIFAGIHLIGALEAYIDAHLYQFEYEFQEESDKTKYSDTKELSLKIAPVLKANKNKIGFALELKF